MNLRKKLCVWLFEKSTKPYAKLFKRNKKAWNLTKHDLLSYPKDSLGHALGSFLTQNNFELIPKLERHDAYHVITNYGTEVENEIALQFFFYGNGKRSLYLFGVSIIGLILLPEYFIKFHRSYLEGTLCNPIHKLDIKGSLNRSLYEIQDSIFITSALVST